MSVQSTGFALGLSPEVLYHDQALMGNVQPEVRQDMAQYNNEPQESSNIPCSAQNSFPDANGLCNDKLQALKRLSKVRSLVGLSAHHKKS